MSLSGRASRLSSRDESPNDRYCKMCQRNKFHCKRCKHKCHRKCEGHTHHCRRSIFTGKESSSHNKIFAGDEHWTKVLQTNEIEVAHCERHCIFNPLLHSPLSATEWDYAASFKYFNTNSSSLFRTSSSVSSYNRNSKVRNNSLSNNNNSNNNNSYSGVTNFRYSTLSSNNGFNPKTGPIKPTGYLNASMILLSSPTNHNNYPPPPINSRQHKLPQSPTIKITPPPPKVVVEKPIVHNQVQSSTKEKNLFHGLIARFVNWIDSNKPEQQQQHKQQDQQKQSNLNSNSANCKIVAKNKEIIKEPEDDKTVGVGFNQNESIRYRKDQKRPRRRAKTIATNASISSSDCDTTDSTASTQHHLRFNNQRSWWQPGQLLRPSSTSTTGSSMMMTSSCTSPATSDCFLHDSSTNPSALPRPSSFKFSLANPPGRKIKFLSVFGSPTGLGGDQLSPQNMTSPSNFSTTTNSSYGSLSSLSSQMTPEKGLDVTKETIVSDDVMPCSAQMRRAAYKSKPNSKENSGSLTSKPKKTWPSKDTLINSSSVEKDSMDVSDTMSLCSMFDNCDQYMKDTLEDWNIPQNDLIVLDLVREGLTFNIHKGHWHGNVFVYKFLTVNEARAQNFLKEVTRLSKIRHENVCLFMGASVSSLSMAIVTSELKGMTVYDRIHLTNDRMPTRLRLNISEHVAQAIGYLHAKKIIVKSINTRNVYFDPKVKLSLLDHSSPQLKHTRPPNTACFSRGVLSYFAPELLKKIRPALYEWDFVNEKEFTMQTDLYAYGTFLYEVMTGQLAMKNMLSDELMWKVVNGMRQPIKHLNANSLLRTLIDRCWSNDPDSRPTFNEINVYFTRRGHLI